MGGDSMSGAPAKRAARPKADKKPAKVELGPELSAMKRLTGELYYPRLNLSARVTRANAFKDAAMIDTLADELLPVRLSETSRVALLAFLKSERASLGVEDGRLLSVGTKAENVLRRLAHLILSLPEAQLG